MASMASKLESVSDDSPEEVMRTAEGKYLHSFRNLAGSDIVNIGL